MTNEEPKEPGQSGHIEISSDGRLIVSQKDHPASHESAVLNTRELLKTGIVLKPDDIGYCTTNDLIYVGQNSEGEYCYTTPKDAPVTTRNEAWRMLAEINTRRKTASGDILWWDLPTGNVTYKWPKLEDDGDIDDKKRQRRVGFIPKEPIDDTNELQKLFYQNRHLIGGFKNGPYLAGCVGDMDSGFDFAEGQATGGRHPHGNFRDSDTNPEPNYHVRFICRSKHQLV